MQECKKNNILIGKNLEELQNWTQINGETKFRGTQLFEWVYKRGVLDLS